jgi:transposase
MGYREKGRMEIVELVRRWQAGEAEREVARQTGMGRATVSKYLAAARALGVERGGAPPTEAQLGQLGRLSLVAGVARPRAAPERARVAAEQERLARWVGEERLQLTRVQELLAQDGVRVSYSTLRRYVLGAGLGRPAGATVRLPETAAGEVAEFDFGRLGSFTPIGAAKPVVVWALVLVLGYSRHCFVWPLVRQTFEEVCAGMEAAWRFFTGVPHRLVLDNFPAAIAGPDPLDPRPTKLFVEYSQTRGFLIDAARPAHPRDKPKVERAMQYVQQRFWKGGTFRDLADARVQAARWCQEVAGQRVHGSTRRVPLAMFEAEEQAALLPAPADAYDVPIWKAVAVGRDHHVQVARALYSVPAETCPPGTALEARADRALVRLYHHGELVKVHPRQPEGGRSTEVADYPPEVAGYAARSPEEVAAQAAALGEYIGQFARRLLDGPFVWAKLRRAEKLLRLAERYTPERLDAACARALGFDLIDVRRLERIVALALEQEGQPAPPLDERLRAAPVGRFARPASAFAHAIAEEGTR